ncbi:MAG: hypothetical protein ACJAZN_002460 [Planctomycetota bacterium]|jgi:hypothetical protein
MKSLLALGVAVAAATTGQANALQAEDGGAIILINEIRADQDGSDLDEYFELLSFPSSLSLDGYTYLTLGDGTAGSGVVEALVDLTGSTTGTDGLFLAGEASMTIAIPDLVTTINFENSDNVTHLLVFGFTGAAGDDLDTDDDGVLDITPWASVIDAVSLIEEVGGGDQVYGVALGFNEVGPNGTFAPAHAFRCLTSLSDWRIGEFSIAEMSDTAGNFNSNCNGVTSVFCDPGAANEVSATGGKMGFAGTFSFQRNDTTLSCADVPNNFGLFIQSDIVMAPAMAPVGGNLCLGGTLIRLNQIVVGVGNQVSLTLDVEDMGLNEFGTVAGSTVHYQYFFRDTVTSGGGNFSNGLTATWTL